jgi:hypothetical protein
MLFKNALSSLNWSSKKETQYLRKAFYSMKGYGSIYSTLTNIPACAIDDLPLSYDLPKNTT